MRQFLACLLVPGHGVVAMNAELAGAAAGGQEEEQKEEEEQEMS